MSLVLQEAPYLYSRALHVSSQWDGDFTALVNEHLPLYIFIGENDEYYGSDKIRNTYAEMAELYRQNGEDINDHIVLDVKDSAYFEERNVRNQHGGGMLVSYDEESELLTGEIVNVSADERILGENGRIDPAKLQPITYDPMNHHYLILGEKAGQAFHDGMVLK